MDKRTRAHFLTDCLEAAYPLAECSLNYGDAWQLMVSVRLAAQCTDARVNIVSAELFEKYPTPAALAAGNIEDITDIVRPCGLGNTKARDIKAGCEMLLSVYGGVMPDSMEELLKLPGVGRKSANLILGDVFKKPAVVADTHCIRISNRMGLCDSKDPAKVESQLRVLLEPERSNDFCHRLVLHGRAVCTARKPLCEGCACEKYCVKNL